MKRYEPQEIEPKWQTVWDQTKLFHTPDKPGNKSYVLDMFPYPSGDGLHVGHPRGYTATDAYAHYRRLTGHDVLHPIGFDAFGLPAENAAIKKGVHPGKNTAANIRNFTRQLRSLGYSYDWSREVVTSDPNYYRWTQWIFLELFKRGLAYQAEGLQWWCPHDKTVLANEQVVDGRCERCGHEVTKKSLKQWFFRITEYADELLDELENLDWPEPIKAMQRNWIGRSQGAELDFESTAGMITVYTTRPDTAFGATYLVLAPEHPLVKKLTTKEQSAAVTEYVKAAASKSEIDRAAEGKDKTGVSTGATVTNPLTKAEIPVWVADYVLASYGTGAIMAVPAHDQRDFDFATRFDLPIVPVVMPPDGESLPYSGEGPLQNSGEYDDVASDRAREQIITDLESAKKGRPKTGFKLRDWLISRQRYWGTPIPIIHCDTCGPQPVPEDQLPVELPEIEDYLPTGDGRSPLAKVTEFVETVCPNCKRQANRETDTMDTFADSSWYFLRYPTPHKKTAAWDKAAVKAWLPVDTYVGGAEHAVLHLLYARFWTKALADAGHLAVREPFTKLKNVGMIRAQDGQKMSKSKGNVINPDEVVEAFGADTVRTFELFIGPFDQAADWTTEGIEGSYRFLKRVWALVQRVAAAEAAPETGTTATAAAKAVTQATVRVTRSIEDFRFNTMVSALMECLNTLQALADEAGDDLGRLAAPIERYLVLLAPMAPHLAEELWQTLGQEESIFRSKWPEIDQNLLEEDSVAVVVQVNGKVRATLALSADGLTEESVTTAALADAAVAQHVTAKTLKRAVYVSGKLLNLVV